MSVVKVRIQKDFTVLYNGVLENPRLSFRAKGLWAYCMSRPDNWEFHVSHLATVSSEGRDAVYSAIKELEDEGLVEKVQEREGGKFKKIDYIIYPYPQEIQKILPLPDFPDTAKPDTVNPPLLSTDLKPRTEEETNSPSPSSLRSSSSDFKKEMMGMMKASISATEEEFEEAWCKYQFLDHAKIPHPKAWFKAVIENSRKTVPNKPAEPNKTIGEIYPVLADRPLATKEVEAAHRAQAEDYQNRFPKSENQECFVVAGRSQVDLVVGNNRKSIAYNVIDEEWIEQTGWE